MRKEEKERERKRERKVASDYKGMAAARHSSQLELTLICNIGND